MKVSKIRIIFILSIIFIPLFINAIEQSVADSFIKAFIAGDAITEFVDKNQLEISNRLGIKYQNVKNKFLISYDISDDVKKLIRNKKLAYRVKIKNLEEDYDKIIFSIPKIKYQREFFFKGNYYISPIAFYTRDWQKISSKHFIFVVSNPELFNGFCIENMEKFFDEVAKVLKFDEKQLKILEKKKIFYYLCENDEEIKLLTGYQTRGIYNIADDALITTFNSHYHELMHLLINFKLGSLPLYTQPFFQEGFAVALGGRGGKETNVILDLGYYLYKSDFIDYHQLLSKADFYNFDASISYPASGLYNRFLINFLGIDDYLGLYLKYSADSKNVDKMKIALSDLANEEKWKEFLNSYKPSVDVVKFPANIRLIYQDGVNKIFQDNKRYYFMVKDTLFIRADIPKENYISKKFREIFKDRKYKGEKYLIIASKEEISIYNLFTNNLIASYISAFSNATVPQKNGLYLFSVKKDFEIK